MSQSHPISDQPGSTPQESRPGILRSLLWVVLVVSVVANTVTSFAGVPTAVQAGLGGVTALAVVALVAQHLRTRR